MLCEVLKNPVTICISVMALIVQELFRMCASGLDNVKLYVCMHTLCA